MVTCGYRRAPHALNAVGVPGAESCANGATAHGRNRQPAHRRNPRPRQQTSPAYGHSLVAPTQHSFSFSLAPQSVHPTSAVQRAQSEDTSVCPAHSGGGRIERRNEEEKRFPRIHLLLLIPLSFFQMSLETVKRALKHTHAFSNTTIKPIKDHCPGQCIH